MRVRRMVTLALVLAAGSGVSARLTTQSVLAPRAEVPVTRAGGALTTLLATFNTGKDLEPRWARWFSVFGPVELGVIERSTDLKLKVWLQGKATRRWLGVDITVDPSKPESPEIVVLQLGGALPPGLRSVQPLRAGEAFANHTTSYLDQMCAGGYFSGAVIVRQRSTATVQHACGLASRQFRAPIAIDTKFSLASVGKVFTAVAILQLVQAGKLSLTDPLSRFIPDYPVIALRGATIGQLLTHASGVGRAERDWIADRVSVPLDVLIGQTTAPSLFAPGMSVRYSNEGFLLLGRIVEVASGQPYAAYLQARIFDPAGMKQSGLFAWSEEPPNTAVPYSNFVMTAEGRQVFEPGPRRSALMLHGARGTPAGGAFSTAPDMVAFTAALFGGVLLDRAHAALLGTAIVNQPPPFKAFGYGVEVASANGTPWFGKSGGAQGVSANWVRLPTLETTVVVLSNYDAASDLVTSYIVDVLTATVPRTTAAAESETNRPH